MPRLMSIASRTVGESQSEGTGITSDGFISYPFEKFKHLEFSLFCLVLG